MNNYKLIKLKEGYIIVSDRDIQIEDYFLIGKTIEQCLSSSEADDLSIGKSFPKIIASTFIPELPSIDFNGLEEEFGIVDLKGLVENMFVENEIHTELYDTNELKNAYKAGIYDGFNKCLSLNKDKLYTKEQL